jgi:Tol biopolymer transport system component
VLDLATGRMRRVAGSSQVAEIDAVSWSPDSSRLVFSAYRQNSRGGLYVVDLSTGRLSPLLVRGPGARAPAWSPDGRSIAFVRGGPGASSIWLLRLSGGKPLRLTRGGVDVSPAWLPDGRSLVFVRRSLARLP